VQAADFFKHYHLLDPDVGSLANEELSVLGLGTEAATRLQAVPIAVWR
jgi:hypothetical protein